ADADGRRDQRREADDLDRAEDRALDPARVAEELAGRVSGEEIDAPGAEALHDQVVEDQRERDDRHDRAGAEQDAGHAVALTAAGGDRGERRHPLAPKASLSPPR